MTIRSALLLFLLAYSFSYRPTYALEKPEVELQEAGITFNRGGTVDTMLTFTDSEGRRVTLSELMLPERPTILIPAYYECPRLCGLLLEGAFKGLNALDLKLGEDYSVVTVSFNAAEGPPLAAEKAAFYRSQLVAPERSRQSWHFLVGEPDQINPLMRSIGFHFKPDQGEFAHAATLVVLTPDGKISQYLTGVTFAGFDLRLALVEASQGKIGSALDHALLFCFRFDPTKGKYTWAAWNVARLVALTSFLFLAVLIVRLFIRERRMKSITSGQTP